MKIGFLGFGEAARAFQKSLGEKDPSLHFLAYDILLDRSESSPIMRAAIEDSGTAAVETVAGLREADWIISAVTADQSLAAVKAVCPHLVQGQVLFDINSVSPERKRECAALIEAAGAAYLDMAVMAPVHPRGHATPVFVAGGSADETSSDLARLGFDYRVVSAEAGAATAIKMVRSLFVKGLEAITVETLLAAKASGCFDDILASISASYPGLGWPETASYAFERTLRHGKRRAAEMRESAATLQELGLRGALATEIAAVQERMGTIGKPEAANQSLPDLADAVLRARLKAG